MKEIKQSNTSSRKIDHIRICLKEKVESHYTGFEDVMLIHSALPEIDFEDVNTNLYFLGKRLSAPILIASMTGGHEKTIDINRNLARAVEELGVGMGVGSQRAAVELETPDSKVVESFAVVREEAPKAFIYANIGIIQILEDIEYAEKAIEMIDADAIAIHLNFLQEAIQPEGELKARGCLDALEEACRSLKVPVIVKETGAGISREVAVLAKKAGVSAIDVGGKGGTSWSGVEVYRANNDVLKKIGMDFWDWGIPTAFSVVDCSPILPTIATGGIRSGIDVAKAIALGAIVGSAALPFLEPATISSDAVVEKLEYFIHGLKLAMFLTSSQNIEELKNNKIFVTGKLREWMMQRGFKQDGR